MSDVVLMSDPKVAAVPVEECGESLVDVSSHGCFVIDERKREDSAGAFVYLRQGVFDRLRRAQEALPRGLRLLFVEGYRPPALQRLYFDHYADRLRTEHPGWDSEELRDAASRFVSPPEIAPHSAGAAVDLTLVSVDGHEIDMGTRVNATPEESDGACYTAADNIGSAGRANRRTLIDALTSVGLVNYPTEWWHWSYGDRYWALATGAAAAHYGLKELG